MGPGCEIHHGKDAPVTSWWKGHEPPERKGNLLNRTLFFALVLCSLVSCRQETPRPVDPEILKQTVIRYNQRLSEGYRTLNMNGLLDVATKERTAKAYYHMAALGEERKRMEAKPRSISFVEIKHVAPDRAEVQTREEWDYRHIDIDSNEVVFQGAITYTLLYTLIRQGDHWLVSDIEIQKEEKMESEGESGNSGG